MKNIFLIAVTIYAFSLVGTEKFLKKSIIIKSSLLFKPVSIFAKELCVGTNNPLLYKPNRVHTLHTSRPINSWQWFEGIVKNWGKKDPYQNYTEKDFKKMFFESKDPKKLRLALMKKYHSDRKNFKKDFATSMSQIINNAFDEFNLEKDTQKNHKESSSKTTNDSEIIEDVKVAITKAWIKKMMITDRRSFNQIEEGKHRDYYDDDNNDCNYYQIEVTRSNFSSSGSVFHVWKLRYKNGFEKENNNVSETIKKQILGDWANRVVNNNKRSFNQSNSDRYRDVVDNTYCQALINCTDGAIKAAATLHFNRGSLNQTTKEVDLDTYKRLHLKWLDFVVNNDKNDFNSKNKDKIRIELSLDPFRYYQGGINMENGGVVELCRLKYKNKEFVPTLEQISIQEYQEVMKLILSSEK